LKHFGGYKAEQGCFCFWYYWNARRENEISCLSHGKKQTFQKTYEEGPLVSEVKDLGVWLMCDSFLYRILLKLIYCEIPI
jgi:hypothetical protein